MGDLGHVVRNGKAFIYLLSEIQKNHKDKRHRDLAVFPDRDGGKYDERKHNPAGAEQPDRREKNGIDDPDHQRRRNHDKDDVLRPVFFFQHRTKDQDIHDVVHQMLPA